MSSTKPKGLRSPAVDVGTEEEDEEEEDEEEEEEEEDDDEEEEDEGAGINLPPFPSVRSNCHPIPRLTKYYEQG